MFRKSLSSIVLFGLICILPQMAFATGAARQSLTSAGIEFLQGFEPRATDECEYPNNGDYNYKVSMAFGANLDTLGIVDWTILIKDQSHTIVHNERITESCIIDENISAPWAACTEFSERTIGPDYFYKGILLSMASNSYLSKHFKYVSSALSEEGPGNWEHFSASFRTERLVPGEYTVVIQGRAADGRLLSRDKYNLSLPEPTFCRVGQSLSAS